MQETQEMQFWSWAQADPLEEEIATSSSILAWKILCGQEEACCNPRGQKELDTEHLSMKILYIAI